MVFKRISFVIYLILTLANNKKFKILKGSKILHKIMNKSLKVKLNNVYVEPSAYYYMCNESIDPALMYFPIIAKVTDRVGIEPTTSRLPGDCSTNCAIGPLLLH